jgi:DNA-binding PadR family transcriptional regulator
MGIKNANPTVKKEKVGKILQVQELIDYFVLAEILDQPRYVREIDDRMCKVLNNVGVNRTYLTTRIEFMENEGYLTRYWDNPGTRYNHFCKITDRGLVYLKFHQRELPVKVESALKFYNSLKKYTDKLKDMDIS